MNESRTVEVHTELSRFPGRRSAAVAAGVVLVIVMGFGRFTFTGFCPLMVADHYICVEGAPCSFRQLCRLFDRGTARGLMSGMPSQRICGLSVLATVVTLGMLWLSPPEWLVITIRGFAALRVRWEWLEPPTG